MSCVMAFVAIERNYLIMKFLLDLLNSDMMRPEAYQSFTKIIFYQCAKKSNKNLLYHESTKSKMHQRRFCSQKKKRH